MKLYSTLTFNEIEAIINYSKIGIFRITADGDFLYANDALVTMADASSFAEISSNNILPMYKHPEDRQYFLSQLKKNGFVKDYELELNSKSKKNKFAVVNASVNGQIISGSLINVTASKNRYTKLIESSMDAIVEVDSKLNIIVWNSAAEKIFNYTKSEILNKPVKKIIPSKYHKIFDEKIADFLIPSGDKKLLGVILQAEGLKSGGEEVLLEISLSFELSNLIFVTAIIRDITDRKKHEALLFEKINDAERLNKHLINRELKMIELKKQIAKKADNE